MTEQPKFLSPEEIQKRQKVGETTQTDTSEALPTPLTTIPSREERLKQLKAEEGGQQKFYNRAGQVEINYETEGRFDIPETLFFKSFSVEDVNNVTLSRPEDILENIVVTLDKLKNEEARCSVCDMLLEEFIETLVAMKIKFNTPIHIHKWMCDCQEDIDDKERVVNDLEVDLSKLNFIPISVSDEKIKEIYKKSFDEMDSTEWNHYIAAKYPNKSSKELADYTKEMELNTIKIKEPIKLPMNGHIYEFMFPRVKHIIQAQKMAKKMYASKIKMVQVRTEANVSAVDLKYKKEQELEKLQIEKDKKTVLFARALTLNKIDGKELSDQEKTEEYAKLQMDVVFELMDFLDNIRFGIQHDVQVMCPICGKESKRSLQREFNPIELLPLDLTATRKHRESSRINIYFG